MFNLILLGPPGAGKGTQARFLAEKYNLIHIETGDILRKIAKRKTSLGRKIKNWMQKGALIESRIVAPLIQKEIQKTLKKGQGFILDGSPRKFPENKILDKYFKEKKIPVKIIHLKISNKEVVKRLLGRFLCVKCKKPFSAPPPLRCDVCKGKVFKRRADDNIKTIKNRLKSYKKQTAPVIKNYKQRGLLIDINGEKAPEKVFKEIKRKIKLNDY